MMDHLSQPFLFEQDTSLYTSLSWPNILIPAALEAVARDQGQIILFSGHRRLLPLGHYLVAWRVMEQESVIFVDGANFFDLPLITKLAKQLQRDSRKLLERIHISRAFTVHQLEALIVERLGTAMDKYSSRLCFVSGLLDTLFDEEVPVWEAVRILKKVMERLKFLADRGHRVIILAPSPPTPSVKRVGLVPLIRKHADRIFTLSENRGLLILEEETKEARGKQWAFPALKLSMKRYSPR
jgi:hypothetical protein